MNLAQSTHVKAMARKMRMHAEAIAARMKALEENDLSDMPVDLVEMNFDDSLYYQAAIRQVYDDMLPKLPKDK
jgi:hypothetical protein